MITSSNSLSICCLVMQLRSFYSLLRFLPIFSFLSQANKFFGPIFSLIFRRLCLLDVIYLLNVVEPPEPNIMTRNPKPPNQPIMTLVNVTLIIAQSFILTGIAFGVYMLTLRDQLGGANTVRKQQSLAFTVLTGMQLTQSFLSKSVLLSVFHTGILSNKILIYAFILSFGFLIIGVEVPGINTWLELESIGGYGWLIVFICAFIHFVIVEVTKLLIRQVFGSGPALGKNEGYAIVSLQHLKDQSLPAQQV